MHFTALFTAAAAVFGAAQATYVAWDSGYDDASRSLTAVSCSDGAYGLTTRYGYQMQGQVPRFPYIAAFQGTTWNSPQCGTCWKLTYNDKSIFVVAVDAAYNGGFTTSLAALNELTHGNAVQFGHVDAVAEPATHADCGLPNY